MPFEYPPATVEPNPLLPGSYLVRYPVAIRHGDDRIEEVWALVLPTHRGKWCCYCQGFHCGHAKAVDEWAEQGRRATPPAESVAKGGAT